jgi:hypothetical protein
MFSNNISVVKPKLIVFTDMGRSEDPPRLDALRLSSPASDEQKVEHRRHPHHYYYYHHRYHLMKLGLE